ncbi:MAG: ABC transporter permease subunit [Roseiflexaceae bacterium]|jgi:ABC-2 type transport system permease protein|nr:MAG: ABC transporter permease [Chloroflexota bacterium]
MRTALVIARREILAYFISPIAYLVSAMFLLISGFLFSLILIQSQQASMDGLFLNVTVVLIFIAPLLTMRLLADEQKSGTLEILLTAPVRDWEVVVGKYLAAMALFGVMLLCTLYYPIILWRIGGNPDWGPVLTGYLGIILLSSAMFAIGTLTSSLTENQIVAAVLGFGILLLMWLIDAAGNLATGATDLLRYLSLPAHYNDFARGAINIEDVVYYLSVTFVALFLATRSLESRRYR